MPSNPTGLLSKVIHPEGQINPPIISRLIKPSLTSEAVQNVHSIIHLASVENIQSIIRPTFYRLGACGRTRDYKDPRAPNQELQRNVCPGGSLQPRRRGGRLVIVDAKTHVAITARDISKMLLIHPNIHADESEPYGGIIEVSFPADSDCEAFNIPLRPTQDLLETWPMVDNAKVWNSDNDGYVVQSLNPDAAYGPGTPSETLSIFLGRSVLLVVKGPRIRWVQPTTSFPELKTMTAFQDGYPILVATDSSLEDIAKRVKLAANTEEDSEGTFKIHGLDKDLWKEKELAMERFRPNIVIGGEGLAAYDEERWEEIEVGQHHGKMLLVSLCHRCQVPNIDVETGVPDTSVPSQILNKYSRPQLQTPNSSCFGINTCPLGSGTLRVGDPVKVTRRVKGGGVLPIPPAKSG